MSFIKSHFLQCPEERVQIKRFKFQAKQAFALNQDPFPIPVKFRGLEPNHDPENPQKPFPYQIIFVDFQINYPDYKTILESDSRFEIYKFRHLTK